jgi:hypothetical protein
VIVEVPEVLIQSGWVSDVADLGRIYHLFDHDDYRVFQVSRARNKPFAPEPGVEYPVLIAEQGDMPRQYPDWD